MDIVQLVKQIYILFWSIDNIFITLTKNILKNFKLEKNSK